jgi:hypothetical protein
MDEWRASRSQQAKMNSIAVRNERYRFTDPRLFSKTTPMAAVNGSHETIACYFNIVSSGIVFC